MQRAMGGTTRELVILDPRQQPRPVVGRVLARGVTDELQDGSYLVLDGIDGKAYFVSMRSGIECDAPLGSVVEVRGVAAVREIDKWIAAVMNDGIYRTSEHFARLANHPQGRPRRISSNSTCGASKRSGEAVS